RSAGADSPLAAGECLVAAGGGLPKKSGCLLPGARSARERFALIDRLKAHFPVAFLCDRLGVSRSGYYEAASRLLGPRETRRSQLTVEVIDAFAKSHQVDGYRKVAWTLRRNGTHVNRKTVASIMGELGLISPQ